MAKHYSIALPVPATQVNTVRNPYFASEGLPGCSTVSSYTSELSIDSLLKKSSPNSNGDAPTAYSVSREDNSPGPVLLYTYHGSFGGYRETWTTGDDTHTIFGSATPYTMLMRSACIQGCTARAIDRFYASFSDANWAETICEYRQVRRMFSLTNNLGPLFKRAARRWGGTAVAGSLWLQTHFGLKPLVNDIFATLETIQRQTAAIYSVAGSASDSYIHYPTWSPSQGVRVNVRVRVHARMQNGHFDIAARLTSMDPARWIWESIPLSLVADWFLNVGGYLQQMEMAALYAKAFRSGTTSIRESSSGSILVKGNRKPNWTSCNTSQEYPIRGAKSNRESYQRSLLYQLPRPTPSVPVVLGARQLVHAYAMMTQALPWKDVVPPRWVSFGPDGKRRR